MPTLNAHLNGRRRFVADLEALESRCKAKKGALDAGDGFALTRTLTLLCSAMIPE